MRTINSSDIRIVNKIPSANTARAASLDILYVAKADADNGKVELQQADSKKHGIGSSIWCDDIFTLKKDDLCTIKFSADGKAIAVPFGGDSKLYKATADPSGGTVSVKAVKSDGTLDSAVVQLTAVSGITIKSGDFCVASITADGKKAAFPGSAGATPAPDNRIWSVRSAVVASVSGNTGTAYLVGYDGNLEQSAVSFSIINLPIGYTGNPILYENSSIVLYRTTLTYGWAWYFQLAYWM